MEYLVVKWLHVISSTVLFGAGVGSAFHMFASTLRGDVPGIAMAARNVVLADWLLTTPAAIFQPLSGLWLVHLAKMPLSTPWLAASIALYVIAIACWLPVVWIQLRMRDHAVAAMHAGSGLPAAYRRLFAWWTGLGVVAFVAFVAVFWLMVVKVVPHGG
jgi:uncharacterized membrane protein